MYRRSVLATLCVALVSAPLQAHHGWGAYDQTRPMYLEGIVSTITWADPHVQLELQLDPNARLPPDLPTRPIPEQRNGFDLRPVMLKAAVPVQDDHEWRVFLAPLARLAAWDVPRPKVGDRIAVIGYLGPHEQGNPAVRAEMLFIDEKIYPLRSGPVSRTDRRNSSTGSRP